MHCVTLPIADTYI